jgi:hypothetical protein
MQFALSALQRRELEASACLRPDCRSSNVANIVLNSPILSEHPRRPSERTSTLADFKRQQLDAVRFIGPAGGSLTLSSW